MTAGERHRRTEVSRRQVLGAVGAGAAMSALPTLPATARDGHVATAGVGVRPQQPGQPPSWFATMGTHYRVAGEQWLGLTRSGPVNADTGFRQDVGYFNGVGEGNEYGIEPVTGRFSGEPRYYDFTGKVHWRNNLRQAVLDAAAAGVDKIMETGAPSIWGNEALNRPEHARFLMEKDGAYFKDCLYELIRYFNSGEFADLPITLYWQIGNEINWNTFFAVNPHGGLNAPPTLNDFAHVSDYVDFFLAPALEAVQTASRDLFGDRNIVKLLVGSVTTSFDFRNGEAKPEKWRKFLELVLERRITADSHVNPGSALVGRRVWQIADLFSIHYSNGLQEKMQDTYDTWVASGKMSGFFNTEEMGINGRGAYLVALFAFRYLDFWSRRRWDPHTARSCFWGDTINNAQRGIVQTGTEALDLLGPYLRDFPLANITDRVRILAGPSVEWHAFRAADSDGRHRHAIYVKPFFFAAARLNRIIVPWPDGKPGALHELRITRLDASLPVDPNGYQPASAQTTDEGIVITFNQDLALSDSFVILATTALQS